MDENVSKAVEWADEFLGSPDCKTPTYWQTIRAHLVELESVLADYENASRHAADDCMAKDVEIARLQSRLAAADALLRKCRDKVNDCMHDYGVKNGGAIVREIDAHLSEPRT